MLLASLEMLNATFWSIFKYCEQGVLFYQRFNLAWFNLVNKLLMMHSYLILTTIKEILNKVYYCRTNLNIFPPMASCLYIEPGPAVDTFNYYSGVCTLPWNYSNFYIFLALWWWLLIVCAVIFCDVFATIGTLFSPRLRMFALGYYVSFKILHFPKFTEQDRVLVKNVFGCACNIW